MIAGKVVAADATQSQESASSGLAWLVVTFIVFVSAIAFILWVGRGVAQEAPEPRAIIDVHSSTPILASSARQSNSMLVGDGWRALICALVAFGPVACRSDTASSTRGETSEERATASAGAAMGSRDVTRVLDFSHPKSSGRYVATIPYGKGRARVGFLGPCLKEECLPPCPCTTAIQASAFDVDSSGKLWILDIVKRRIAVFQAGGRFAFDEHLRGVGYRSLDMQLLDSDPHVLSQARNFNSRISVAGSSLPHSAYSLGNNQPGPFSVGRGRLYMTAFRTDPDTLQDEEIPVEINIPAGARRAKVERVPGRPFRDGWLQFIPYQGERLIPLSVESDDFSWSKVIHLKLRQVVSGEPKSVRGNVSWELEVAADGTIHVLMFAGTYSRKPVDGYWYVTVSAAGAVGQAIPLSGPGKADDQQVRRLSLNHAEQPMVMWAGGRGLRFERLRPTIPAN